MSSEQLRSQITSRILPNPAITACHRLQRTEVHFFSIAGICANFSPYWKTGYTGWLKVRENMLKVARMH